METFTSNVGKVTRGVLEVQGFRVEHIETMLSEEPQRVENAIKRVASLRKIVPDEALVEAVKYELLLIAHRIFPSQNDSYVLN